ncbi:MAG: phosphatidylinositol transfer protein [Proteobacteria bacterium]|nr:MAG: phosphatidylinositol transfer protein [Pseudomonadota bacterium]
MMFQKKASFAAAMILTFGLSAACGRDESAGTSVTSALTSELPSCQLATACSQALPQLPSPEGFSGLYKKFITKGKPLHRGRDLIVASGAPIWIQAKFSYGIVDADLHKEPIDIYLSQGCNSGLKKIGQAITSNDNDNPAVDDVKDTGGRIYVNLADLGIKSLPVGRHRVVFVVPGDNTTAELYITVVDPRQKIVVSDIDGTLTESELAAAVDVFGGSAKAHAGAPEALQILKNKGYEIIYLTARAEWFGAGTRKWLREHGFPLGTLRTTNSKIGATGQPAIDYKTRELVNFYYATGITPTIALGNKETDVVAYGAVNIEPQNTFFINLDKDLAGGIGFSEYDSIAQTFKDSPKVCI